MDSIRSFFQRLFPRRSLVEKEASNNGRNPEPLETTSNPVWGFADPGEDVDLICQICLCVYRDPVLTLSGDSKAPVCAHVFCENCVVSYVKKHSYHDCPLCRKPWKPPINFKPDPITNKKLAELVVLCKLCGQNVPYHDRIAHRSQCPDCLVTTPREVYCTWCDVHFQSLYHRKQHDASCPGKQMVPCPCCQKDVPQNRLFNHQLHCSYVPSSSEGTKPTAGRSNLRSRFINSLWLAGVLILGAAAVGLTVFMARI